jgi:putative membrane protein
MITAHGLPFRVILPVIWQRILLLIVVSCSAVILYQWFGHQVRINDTPLSIFGTVLAILMGFRVNNAYDRWWEARKVWGAIVNDSRSVARLIIGFCKGAPGTVVTQLVYRHIAFCYATANHLRGLHTAEATEPFLSPDEHAQAQATSNVPNAIMMQQTQHVELLRRDSVLSEFHQRQIEERCTLLIDSLGKCERIKKTVFPHDYSWYASRLVDLFGVLIPWVIVDDTGTWQTVLWTLLLGYAFYAVDRLALVIEKPFQNRVNDTAMTAISRTIEIDLRQMLGETDVPEPVQPVDGVLM